MSENKLERRKFLKMGAGVSGLALFSNSVAKAVGEICGLTPPQTSGPFYPGESRFDVVTDLTKLPGRFKRAEGQIIYIKGRVVDVDCKSINNANVEIWQACHTGRYNHGRDPNPAPLDPDFKYWGETFTNEKGEYEFKTIIPGAYPASEDWDRPPHIHFRVSRLGYKELVTQMYFKGHPLNEKDLILQDLSPADQENVLVEFKPHDQDYEALIGYFQITMMSVR